MNGRSSSGVAILFLATAIGFTVVSLDLRDKQRQIDALKGKPDAAVPDGEESLSNEEVAIAALRNLISAQVMIQQSGKIDEDEDGTGEYGGLLEMAGVAVGRMHTKLRIPEFPRFDFDGEDGIAELAGYCYRVFLLGRDGTGLGEPPSGFARRLVDPENSERRWCCYAWPLDHGRTGTKTFLTNQAGDVHYTDAAGYSGPENGPAADAGFVLGKGLVGSVAEGAAGTDGHVWAAVED